ncbi:MAG: beta-3-deoxy-D-manno-oct-2-ulosonic acid transferase [Verrucomicrobiota bacterium]
MSAQHLTETPPCFTGHYCAVGFSPWKKKCLRPFLPNAQLTFVRSLTRVPSGASLIVWGRTLDAAIAKAIHSGRLPAHTPVLRIEDGFLRSVGLGASLTKPVSWVIDPVGIYYDPTVPSALERLLESHPFPEPLLVRAQNLIERILSLNLTKYNVGSSSWSPPSTNRPLFLVPGQVEFDASIQYGTQGVRTNLALLQAVRKAHPDAFLLYKPHPDVLAGLRARGPEETEALSACDAVVTDVSMAELLRYVDQVHLMTSLTGFEALLRRKTVVCYGAPFYAGWGLTEDRAPIPRRGRNLSLPQLVTAALLLYPTYVHPETNQRVTAEIALEILAQIREKNKSAPKSHLMLFVQKLACKILSSHNQFNDLKRARKL